MKNGKILDPTEIYILWNKRYNIVAFSNNSNHIKGFARMLGNKKYSFIKKEKLDHVPFDKTFIKLHTVFEFQNTFITSDLDSKVMDFIEQRQERLSLVMEHMLSLASCYKFNKEEKNVVDHFSKIYDFYFLRDIYGTVAFDILEDMDFYEAVQLYLSTIPKNK